jgi:hypothetical protein
VGRTVRVSTEMLPNSGLKRHHNTGLFDDFGEIGKRSLRTDLHCANYVFGTGMAGARGSIVWLRHYTTSLKVAVSSPDEVDIFN